MSDADAALAPGTRVGPYQLEHRIGGGGVGDVYAALEPTIRKRVAIKVLRRSFAGEDAAAARFEREARAANDVRHPAIVDIFASGKLPDGRPYLVMSLLEGRSLRAELATRGALPSAEAWAIAREIAEALGAAHHAGIVHRDLKPDNIFLERFASRTGARPARPRLLDFGLAMFAAGSETAEASPMKLTQTGAPMGTPAYMAPEQWWCAGVGPATDQYALGALLFEMLTGRAPFDTPHFVELMQAHLNTKPPALRERGCDAGVAVEALVARSLAKKPEARFASMEALVTAGDEAFASVMATPTEATLLASMEAVPSNPASAAQAGPAKADTELASTPPATLSHLRRFLVVSALILIGGAAAFIAAGYAGDERHDVRGWIHIAGMLAWVALVVFGTAVMALVYFARERARGGPLRYFTYWLAVLPGLIGACGTYLGWHISQASVERGESAQQLVLFNAGMFEANASRFIGFISATLLCLMLVALAGVRGGVAAGPNARGPMAAAAGLALLATLSAMLGVPSGALIAGVGATIVGLGLALPTTAEHERTLAGALAFGFVVAASFARIEAREAVLWSSELTRAERAAEIVATMGERTATWAITLATLALLCGLAFAGLRRGGAIQRPRAPTLVLASVLLAGAVGDAVLHVRFLAVREKLRAELAPQFTLFAQLDPPTAPEVKAVQFVPHKAPALQIARDTVAINGKGVAKLEAIASAAGAANLGRDLGHALASLTPTPGAPDLAITADRGVPYGTVLRVLRIARDAGVRNVEFLLTRGASPKLSPQSPPEASFVLATDFVALPAPLGDRGFAPAGDAPFGDVAPTLIRAALTTRGPVPLAVP